MALLVTRVATTSTEEQVILCTKSFNHTTTTEVVGAILGLHHPIGAIVPVVILESQQNALQKVDQLTFNINETLGMDSH